MKHGRLNVGPSQSLQSLLDILEDLWTQAIHEVLEIKREDLKVGKSTGPSHSHLAMSMVHDVVETYAVAFKPTGTVLSNHVAGGGGKLSEMF